MSKSHVERRLIDTSDRLKHLSDDLRVADEQLQQLAHEEDDARLRSLVSETPLADKDYREAARHADAMRKHRKTVADDIQRLDALQDELLDRLSGG